MTPSPVSVVPCTAPVGPTVTTSRDPLEMFSHYFDDDIIGLVVRETNTFAAQTLGDTTTWETNAAEIKAYLGFQLLMGINRLSEIRDYWARDAKLHYSPIASHISRDRLSRYLHFVDNSALPSRDEPGFHQLQKVLPVVTALKERFVRCYNPHPQNSIDEAMIPYKGICTSKQHNFHVFTCTNVHITLLCTCKQVVHETIHAHEAGKAGVQGVGEG